MTPQEEAVICAAKSWAAQHGANPFGLNAAGSKLLAAVDELHASEQKPSAWFDGTWSEVRPGDWVKVGTAMAEVIDCVQLEWHNASVDYWRPIAREHRKVHVEIEWDGQRGKYAFLPLQRVEIIRSVERMAEQTLRDAGTDPERVPY